MLRFFVILPYAIFCGILLCQTDFVPLWDAWVYAECAARAAHAPTELHNYSCAGHVSHAYIALLALPTLWGKQQQMWHLLLVNAALGCVAIHSTVRIATLMHPARTERWDVAWLGLLVSVHPQLLASAVFVNLDFAVYALGMACLAALLERRYFRAGLVGCVLAFSKETGVALYLILALCVLLLRAGPCRQSYGSRSHAKWHPFALGLPVLALVVVYVFFPAERSDWAKTFTIGEWLSQLTHVRWREPHERAVWAALFVLQFGWLITTTVGLALLQPIWRFRCRSTLIPHGMIRNNVAAVFLVALISTYTLTRAQTYVNTRYFGVLYALGALVFLTSTIVLIRSVPLRRAMLATCVALFAFSSFRTIDPLSKQLYGTFEFGEHRMLSMTSLSQECCGAGLDQLVYNLEFVQFHRLLDMATRDFRPSKARPIVVANPMAWNLAQQLEAHTFARAMPRRRGGSQALADLFGWSLVPPSRPQEILFLALPNADNRQAREELSRWYNHSTARRFERNGYEFLGLQLTRR